MMFNWLRGMVVRIGRRGSYLLFLALLDFVYGWSLISLANPTVANLHIFPSTTVWGIAWGVVGLVCLVEAFATLDRLAFTLAVLIKFMWGMVMLFSWISAANPYGWISATVFLGFAALTSIVSFWPEQSRFRIEDR
jgi:hypothetical protein